ncbi:MAG: hypothetical protein ACJ792_02475 [Gemmatimonadaceae bacterium]
MRLSRSFSAALTLPLVMACHSSTGPGRARVIGNIDASGTSLQVIDAPATVAVNQAVAIRVSTFGNSCVSAAGAEVVVDGLIAAITPYDMVSSGQCLDYMAMYPRDVQVRFAQPGTATIRVTGRRDGEAGLITVERSITVAP